MAGGVGTRLWPMSRARLPKQLIPFIGGKSLLKIAYDRLDGLVPADRRYICAGQRHKAVISEALGIKRDELFLGEPEGRDTLGAVGFAAAVIARVGGPDATIAVFTADHIIDPVDRFVQIVEQGYELAKSQDRTLVTFGITPTHAATGYGYLQLGESVGGGPAWVVDHFREKPDEGTAEAYLAAGAERYLWNSGMFVWKADTLLQCIAEYEPDTHAVLTAVAEAWEAGDEAKIGGLYPKLKKISVDYAVMERASEDAGFKVAAIPMPVTWVDVGSWPAFSQILAKDEHGNALGAKHLAVDTTNTLVVSEDKNHLVATIGCDDMIVIHTKDATLVCRADQAEKIRDAHRLVGEQYGDELH